MTTPSSESARYRGRWQVLLLGLVFLAPVVGATLLFFSGWRPGGQSKHDELVEPARAWPAVAMHGSDGKPIATKPYADHWTLIYVVNDDCDATCENALGLMHRLHLAQGKEADRVRRALVVLRTPRADLSAVVSRYPGTVAWIAVPQTSAALDTFFATGTGGAADGSIRFMDPRGYYMMRFPSGSDPSDIRRDLARLLKLSSGKL